MTTETWTVRADGSLTPGMQACLEAAIAAPSVHNTQPWKFRLRGRGIDVFADHNRRLDVIDPRGRELLISVGAAILNLRVAILAHGHQPLLRLFPAERERNLVARVTPGPPVHPNPTVRALASAIPRRRTNRRPFSDVPVPEHAIEELAAAARVEGGTLTVAGSFERDWLLGLVHAADQRFRAQPSYRAELAEWTFAAPGRRDGIPPEAFGPWSALEAMPIRDFGLVQPPRQRRTSVFEPDPMLAVLRTFGDGPTAWLRAGQAIERVLLTATVRGLSTTLMTPPLEIPQLRDLLIDQRTGETAQAIVRIGYGPATAPTPRRPLYEVLLPPSASVSVPG